MKTFKEGNEKMCAVYGPTCDALDTITMANLLPVDLSIGDLLYSENIGAWFDLPAVLIALAVPLPD